jgi:hypothetical protein
MRVLVKEALIGSSKPYPIQKGEQDLPDEVATDLISRGLADPIKPIQKSERATVKTKQTRSKK